MLSIRPTAPLSVCLARDDFLPNEASRSRDKLAAGSFPAQDLSDKHRISQIPSAPRLHIAWPPFARSALLGRRFPDPLNPRDLVCQNVQL
jgi:hypothetical protein